MQLKRFACLAMGVWALALHGGVSGPIDLVATPSSAYWTTLVTSSPVLTCEWAQNAVAATLVVSGKNFNEMREYAHGEGENLLVISDVTFPVAATHEDEHLYTLELTFRDAAENVCSTQSAKLANTRGGLNAGTRLVVTDDLTSFHWRRVKQRSVLIPIIREGVEEVALQKGDAAAETLSAGVNGRRGWYEWPDLALGLNTFTALGETATFKCSPVNLVITFH